MDFSLIVPIYNDAYLATDFCDEYQRVMTAYYNTDRLAEKSEVIFVNDGSREDVEAELRKMKKYPFVKIIELSRNFGQHIALTCGYHHASGKYVGMMNVDMEDPPDQIPLLLDQLKNNRCDIVYGLRKVRYSGISDKITSKVFHTILNKMTGFTIPTNSATLRIMNRAFIDNYNKLSEKSRFLPGLEMWMGFRKGYVHITHQKRKQGTSSYTFKKRILFAMDAIISFSDLPLRVMSGIGFLVALMGFLLLITIVTLKLFFIEFQAGYASLISIIVALGGLQLFCIGSASLYIGRVLKEVQNRPLYIIKGKVNFADHE
jgi:glycosyltransferase involved in cell wall biosynthesis